MKKRILIADGDKTTRESLTVLLENLDYVTIGARSPRQAVRLSLMYPFDLVLLEVNAEAEGWEALDWLERLHPFLPIVLLTTDKRLHGRAEAARADALLEKPVNSKALLHTVRILLAESHHDRMDRTNNPDSEPMFASSASSPATRLLTRN
jgi:DNA-binding NtrC family response regulator